MAKDNAAIIAGMRANSDAAKDEELRESMKHGWDEKFPAVRDKATGIVLMGNRRLRMAAELGIAPIVEEWEFGTGTDADVTRLRVAFVSNAGRQDVTKEDRKRAAIAMFEAHGWTQQQIAAVLSVSQVTVCKYLAEVYNSVINPPPRPKGGRPRKAPKPKTKTLSQEGEKELVERVRQGERTRKKLATEFGVGEHVVQLVIKEEDGRQAAITEDPLLDPKAELSLTAQEKLEAFKRRYKKQCDEEYEEKLKARITKHINEYLIPLYQKKIDEADRVLKARKGIMTRASYRRILSLLHPDKVTDEGQKKRHEEAFLEFSKLELLLCDEAQVATPTTAFPRSYDEMIAARAATTEKRRTQRNGV